MEWKLFEGDTSIKTTKEWYSEREAAHHLEENKHIPRLTQSALLVKDCIDLGASSVVDLGCGDGGFLSLIKEFNIKSWGYDISIKNVEYAKTVRNVDCRYTDFSNDSGIEYGDVAVLTEVLEHLADPHTVIKNLPAKYLIASSPCNETDQTHYVHHLWAWDEEGFENLLKLGNYKIIKKFILSKKFQLVLAVKE
jgi:SAM-dependent methyltransferase